MSRTIPTIISLAVISLALAGCSDSQRQTFGLEITPPNAFDVATEAPLSLPPELGQLPAPQPGAPRPQQVSASQQGEEVLAPSTALQSADTQLTQGQQSLLAAAGPTPPAGIRADVNHQAELDSRDQGFVDRLMFGPANPPDQVVNASAEARRLQENAALGESTTTGATPQTTTAKPGILNRIFGGIF